MIDFTIFFLLAGIFQVPIFSGLSTLPLSIVFLLLSIGRKLNCGFIVRINKLSLTLIIAAFSCLFYYSLFFVDLDPIFSKRMLGNIIFGVLSFLIVALSKRKNPYIYTSKFRNRNLPKVLYSCWSAVFLMAISIFIYQRSLLANFIIYIPSSRSILNTMQRSGEMGYSLGVNKITALMGLLGIVSLLIFSQRRRFNLGTLSFIYFNIVFSLNSLSRTGLATSLILLFSLVLIYSSDFQGLNSVNHIRYKLFKKFLSFSLISILVSGLFIYLPQLSQKLRITSYQDNYEQLLRQGKIPPRIRILSGFTHCIDKQKETLYNDARIYKCMNYNDFDNTFISAWARGGFVLFLCTLIVIAFQFYILSTLSSSSVLTVATFIWLLIVSMQQDLLTSPLLWSPFLLAYMCKVTAIFHYSIRNVDS